MIWKNFSSSWRFKMKGFRIITKSKKGEKALTEVIIEDNKFLEEHKDERQTKVFFAFFERIVSFSPPKYVVKIQEVNLKMLGRLINKNILLNNLINRLPQIKDNAIVSMKSYGAIIKKDYEVEVID
jgi:hypothetical protein